MMPDFLEIADWFFLDLFMSIIFQYSLQIGTIYKHQTFFKFADKNYSFQVNQQLTNQS